MSQYTNAGFAAAYNNTGGPFNNSATGGVTGLTLQQFSQDIADTFVSYSTLFNTDILYAESDDFINSNSGFWSSAASGAGATYQSSTFGVDNTEHAFGVVALTTGTTAGGYAYQYKLGQIKLGYGHAVTLRFRIAAEALSTVTDRYTMYLGIGDAINGTEHSNGIYFKYNDSVSANYQCVTANGGVRTATTTTVAQSIVYKTFEIRVDGAAATATFSIDGTVAATISTNMPVGVLVYPAVFGIVKSAGTTARRIDNDYYNLIVTRSSAR